MKLNKLFRMTKETHVLSIIFKDVLTTNTFDRLVFEVVEINY